MYNPRTRPLDNTAKALTNITCWTNPGIADQTIFRHYQMLNATKPKIAKEPKRKVLPINTEAPSNPKMAMEIFMKLIAKQKEENCPIITNFCNACSESGKKSEIFSLQNVNLERTQRRRQTAEGSFG